VVSFLVALRVCEKTERAGVDFTLHGETPSAAP
jgi:hypothetical protein